MFKHVNSIKFSFNQKYLHYVGKTKELLILYCAN